MKGQGLWGDLLSQRFARACTRLGLNRERVELDLSRFTHQPRQPGLFDDEPGLQPRRMAGTVLDVCAERSGPPQR